jgi:quercetin dioxygenase-like cupin family protein
MLLGSALFFLLPVSFPQELPPINLQTEKIEFENDQIRVVRIRYAPHANSGMHSHPQRAVVRTTDRHIRETKANGQTEERSANADEFVWVDAGTHSIENLGESTIETIEIEFKHAFAPSVRITAPPARESSQEGSAVPVQDEPHHHWIFENQYVRVLDVVLPPGESTLMHTHSYDNVAVRLSDSVIQKQDLGKDWDGPSRVQPGQVTFTACAKHPYTHRVKNAGTTTFRVMDIELLQKEEAAHESADHP